MITAAHHAKWVHDLLGVNFRFTTGEGEAILVIFALLIITAVAGFARARS